MDPVDLARRIGARVVAEGHPPGRTVDRVYAGDRISDLLTHASQTTLLVTNLSSALLVCVAELMDVPAICLVGGQDPTPEILAKARAQGMFLMVSSADLFETCGRVHRCWNDSRPGAA
ncbi:MAG: DRTGG domain-containing protein [Planctomycetota bacterium]|nr:DRTGG domain-containing protein [Planctomycetota bacterium]